MGQYGCQWLTVLSVQVIVAIIINIYKNGMFIFTQNVRDAIQDDKSYGSKEKLRAVSQ